MALTSVATKPIISFNKLGYFFKVLIFYKNGFSPYAAV